MQDAMLSIRQGSAGRCQGSLAGRFRSANDPVENVSAERVAFRQAWMVEIVLRIASHTQLLHDADGAQIRRNRERDERGKMQVVESVANDGTGAFRGQSPAPLFCGETPADLDAGREVRIESRNADANESDEIPGALQFGCVEAVTVLIEVSFNTVDHGAALGSGQGRGKEFDDCGVSVDAGERRVVSCKPAAKNHAVSFENRLVHRLSATLARPHDCAAANHSLHAGKVGEVLRGIGRKDGEVGDFAGSNCSLRV